MNPISDLFIRIKNANRAGHESVQISHSQFKQEIVRALERARYLGKIERKGKRIRKALEITLLYDDEEPKIRGVKLISKPSRRLYTGYKDLRKARHGGIMIVSTPRGVMSGEEARKAKVGGELIAEVW